MTKWSTRWRWDTEFSADSVEWCPVEPYHHVLVCGTYELDKAGEIAENTKQRRCGRIYLFAITDDVQSLAPIQTIETSGILDQKWCYHPIQGHPTLAVVSSEGLLQLYQLVNQDGTLSLKLWIEDVIGQDILALSLDWSTNKTPNAEPRIVVSDSSGYVTVMKRVGDTLERMGSWKTHGFEAWVAAFNYWNSDVFYSGGDDCLFKCYDVRVAEPVSSNRSHEAGVTAIRSHVEKEHQLLTGSYDEKVRLWDVRNLKCHVTETNVNGGVWRLKWHPFKPTFILGACMYGGFRILKLEQDFDIVCEYKEHESIAYGADWRFDGKRDIVATCSFYDGKLHVGEVFGM